MQFATLADALDKRDALDALGQEAWVKDDAPDLPWKLIHTVESGAEYRLNGPVGIRLIATVNSLNVHWHVNFERREANGTGRSDFDREHLRDVIMQMKPLMRHRFALFLREHVLSGLLKTTTEIRNALNKQLDSEDCVRGLIAYANEETGN